MMTLNKKVRGVNNNFWTPMRVTLTTVVLGLIAFGGLSSCTSSDEKPVANQPGTKPAAGAPPPRTINAPPANAVLGSLASNIRQAKLKTVNGSTITLGDYSGKVLLVNLWATWCGPCRSETPELVKLHKEFQSQGVEMVGLTNENDPRESPEGVANFVREFQVDYKIGWATSEVLGALNEVEPQRDAIPQSYIISRDGHILRKFVGFSPVGTPPQIRQAITDALNYKG
jgi:thiol-disulfide isomerase/thioredoxin